jgi:hypothetical protein
MAVDNLEDLSQCQYRNFYYSAIFLIKIFEILCSSRPRHIISVSEYSNRLNLEIFWSSRPQKNISISASKPLSRLKKFLVSISATLSRLEKCHVWASATLSRLGLGMLFRSRHPFPFVLPMSANSFPHVHSVPTTQLSVNKPIWP